MPKIQKTCIKEIMAAARLTNSKGHRYTNDWIMFCILMHIRSPSAYEFKKKRRYFTIALRQNYKALFVYSKYKMWI